MNMSAQMSDALSLSKIIEGKTFRVPLYQRNYKWNEEVAVKLVQDLLKAYQEGTKKSIGLITLYKGKDEEIYDVIDGQQRLITLTILFSLLYASGQNPIKLCFQRDGAERDGLAMHRGNALYAAGAPQNGTTDTDRIVRNHHAMADALQEYKRENAGFDCNAFATFALEKCIMLCSVMKNPPVDEFMNLNAYKTAFSVCDYVRSHLIMLNTFYKKELEENISDILGGLSKYTYKTAVAELYNQILDILYIEENESYFSSPYKVLVNTKRCSSVLDADAYHESRINVLFGLQDRSRGYRYEPEDKTFAGRKQELIKLSWVYRLLERLKHDMEKGDFSAAKAIDNYEKLKGESFISLLSKLEEEDKNLSLSELLNKYSNVNMVLMKQISGDDLNLANRYFEAYASAGENKATNNAAETGEDCPTPHMTEKEIVASISGTGRYVLDRFLTEQHYEIDSTSRIPPVLDLTDKENSNLGDKLPDNDVVDGAITVENLFKNVIKIPVIQRDYCMGAQFSEKDKNNFLTYLVTSFECHPDKTLNISTILVSKEQNCDAVYIFDGQQRTYTLYQILTYFGYFDKEHKGFEFIGRGLRDCGSSYAKEAVKELQKWIETDMALKNYDEQKKKNFVEFLLKKVLFTVQQVDDVSGAEQFFMDINGGVALEPYEIYKSCLYDRLTAINGDFAQDFMHRIENGWLDAVYKLLKIEPEDNSDKEEITEIRLIEYLFRYFYKEKTGRAAGAFDALPSKSAVVEEARAYLGVLEKEDFEKVKNCMDGFVEQLNAELNYIAKIHEECFSINSNGDRVYLDSVKLIDKTLQVKDKAKDIISVFVSSFSPGIRKKLLWFYSCGDSWEGHKWLIEKIYDKDELANSVIQLELNEPEPDISYCNPIEVARASYVGGYNNNINKIPPSSIYQTETPAYYANMSGVERFSSIIRPHYLYEQKGKTAHNSTKVLFFFTDGKYRETIKQPDGSSSMFSLSVYDKLSIEKDVDPYTKKQVGKIIYDNKVLIWLTFRTDAYRLCNRDTLQVLLPEDR